MALSGTLRTTGTMDGTVSWYDSPFRVFVYDGYGGNGDHVATFPSSRLWKSVSLPWAFNSHKTTTYSTSLHLLEWTDTYYSVDSPSLAWSCEKHPRLISSSPFHRMVLVCSLTKVRWTRCFAQPAECKVISVELQSVSGPESIEKSKAAIAERASPGSAFVNL